MADGGAVRACPMCGEEILVAARKCRWCNEWVSERDRASGGPARPAHATDDRSLVVPNGARIPGDVCAMCGGRERVDRWKKTFVYTPSWVYFFLVLGPIPCAIAATLVQKKAPLSVPECAACRGARWRANLIGGLGIGLGALIAFPFAGGFIGDKIDPRSGAGIGILIGFCAWFVAFILVAVLWIGRTRPKCKLITDAGEATLQYPLPNGLRALFAAGADEAVGAGEADEDGGIA
jgi:hypothetical protein